MTKVGLAVKDGGVGIHLPNPIAIQTVDKQTVENNSLIFITVLRG